MKLRIEIEVESAEDIERVIKALQALNKEPRRRSNKKSGSSKGTTVTTVPIVVTSTSTTSSSSKSSSKRRSSRKKKAESELPDFVADNPWLQVIAERSNESK